MKQMLGFAWLTLREAQEALKNRRLEEAHRLLSQSAAQGHKRSWELLEQVARGYIERGQERLQQEDAEAAWHDLLQAEQLGNASPEAGRLRQALIRLGFMEVNVLLQAGEPAQAAATLRRLRDRSVQQPELQRLEAAAQSWLLAREQAERGEFAQALDALARVRRLLPGPTQALENLHAELEQKQASFATLLVQLHGATDAAHWREVLELAEKILALAPQHQEARKLRSLAWKSVEPATVSGAAPVAPAVQKAAEHSAPSQRFLLWIDGVGSYLVCLGTRVTLGQATSETYVDIPLFADVSRLHARVTRDTEGYLLEAIRPVLVNTQQVTNQTILRHNDRVTLGISCQLQFRQPAAVSTSARLDLVSGHRLPLSVDGVLLMADTLLLGPGNQVHVTVPDLKQAIILYRHKDSIGVRYPGNLVVDGRSYQERALLGPHAAVTSDDVAFAIEPLGPRMGKV